jgi:hypothetical protein
LGDWRKSLEIFLHSFLTKLYNICI